MQLTDREWWAVIHGLILGTGFLLAFAGGLVGLWSLRAKYLTVEGVRERLPRLGLWTSLMALVAWLTVFTGTWIVYPWYRDGAPTSAKNLLLADENTAQWHEFGMEWKEHVAWLAPFLATAVAFVILYYGVQLIQRPEWRRPLLILFTLAFAAAGVAGLFGAFITKASPVL
ncbi:MAG: hypothetical protein ABI725_01710 [Chloroflexota bacterium]